MKLTGSQENAIVRELALYYSGRDRECTETLVCEWPEAARLTILRLYDELVEAAGPMFRTANDPRDA